MASRYLYPALTTQALFQEWKKGKLRPAYYFYGEDAGGRQAAVETLQKLFQSDEFNTSSFSGGADEDGGEIVSICRTPPMFSQHRLVIVRAVKFGAPARRLIADYLREPLDSTVLVLVSDEVWMEAKNVVGAGVSALGGLVQFNALTEGDAVARIRAEARRAGYEIAADAAEFLVEEAGTAWGVLRAELEKLSLFMDGRKIAALEDITACLGYHRETSPFDLPRSLQRRDAKQSLSLLRRLLGEGNDPYRLLAQITGAVTKQMSAKRMVRTGANFNQIAGKLRLNRKFDVNYLDIAAKVPEAALIDSMKACLETEVALKSKTWLAPKAGLEHLILRICGKEK